MNARHRRLVMALLGTAVLAFGQPAAATPIPVHIDRFLVEKNGSTFFDDDFTDGLAPPSGTGGFSYAVQGTPTESGGRVLLDPAGSITSPGAGFDAGMTVNVEGAILLSNIDPTNTTAGLKSNHTFSATGVFDLVLPSPRDLYGIRFTDLGTSNGDDLVRLLVGPPGATPDPRVFFTRQVGTTVTTIASATLDFNHDQIALKLTKGDAGSNAVTASFWYIDGGIAGTETVLGPTTDLFHGENFTRAQFFAVWVVPVPGSLALIAAGVFGLRLYARRRTAARGIPA